MTLAERAQALAGRLEDAHTNCDDDDLARLLMDALLFVRPFTKSDERPVSVVDV